MQIVTPVTDYIPRSILSADGDVVRRASGIPARVQQRTLIKAWMTATQTFAGVGQAVLQLDDVVYDVNTEWDTGNYRFQADRTMTVLVCATLYLTTIPLADPSTFYVRKNAGAILRGDSASARLNYFIACLSGIIDLVNTDTIDFWYTNSTANNHVVAGGNNAYTTLSIAELV